MDDSERPGAPIPGAEHHEPPPAATGEGDERAPDFTAEPVTPPKEREQKETPRPRPRQPKLETQLEDFFGGIALMVAAMGDQVCAEIIATQAKPLADAYGNLARKNERVRRMLEMMMEGSAWGQVITVTAATVIPIAAHHDLYPKGFPLPFSFGIGPPPPPSDDVRDAETKEQ
jgi:hypothetical protein